MANQTPVTLSVEFAGLCLYVIDDSSGTRTVSVLMPTCVPDRVDANGKPVVSTTHDDGSTGARHVPYLLMDLANLDPPPGQQVAGGVVADGPLFQVVRRLDREEIFFPEQPPGPVTINPKRLFLPDLGRYKDRITLKNLSSPKQNPELNVRTILTGGTLTATAIDGSDKDVESPSEKPDWDRDVELWAGSIEWTGKIQGPLKIRIHRWDTDQDTSLITLKPVITRDGKSLPIKLKIANLCETNPLEWREFEHTVQTEDVDFKWLFRLFEIRAEHPNPNKLLEKDRLLDAVGVPDPKRGPGLKSLPYPKLKPRKPRVTGSTGCTGGQFGLP